jgi:hypothetical protein
VNVTRRLSIATAAAALAVPALASCGFGVQTEQVYNPAVGTNDRSGQVDVLDALVVSGSKGHGTVVAGLSNNNELAPDKLVQVSGAGEDAGVTVQQTAPAKIPPGGFVQLADLPSGIFVQGDQVVPGRLVRLTFTFENSESVTLSAPVVDRTSDYYSVPTEAPKPSESPSTSPSESVSPSPSDTSSPAS